MRFTFPISKIFENVFVIQPKTMFGPYEGDQMKIPYFESKILDTENSSNVSTLMSYIIHDERIVECFIRVLRSLSVTFVLI